MAQSEIVQPASQAPDPASFRPHPAAFRKAGPGAFITSWRNLLVIIIILAALAYGWKVTQVDFVSLVVNLPKSERIFTGLMQPDVVSRIYETATVQAPVQVGGVEAPGQSKTDIPGGGSLTVSPSPVQPGQPLTITVTGAAANSDLNLLLVDSVGTARPIRRGEKTDASGNYTLTFPIPPAVGLGTYQVRAETATATGGWRLSETFLIALDKMIETIFLALMGTFFALMVSVPLSFLGARNLMAGTKIGWAIYSTVRTIFNVLRSIETLILAVIMAVVVGLGPFAGVMAIVIHSIGAMGKLYSEAIESIDPGPIEAITATGANRLQVVLFAVLPQVVPQFLSFTMYRWDINVRLSTIIGLVGGGGIGFILIQYINLLQWNQAATALWLIGIVVIVMDWASAVIRQKLI
jgi:phosphonate transport system permease protein